MFAPLSMATKERVAAKLAPLAVHAGEIVIQTGETGDRFYIIGDGEVLVEAAGVSSHLRHPDCFGEIALLRSMPRTAKVTALIDYSSSFCNETTSWPPSWDTTPYAPPPTRLWRNGSHGRMRFTPHQPRDAPTSCFPTRKSDRGGLRLPPRLIRALDRRLRHRRRNTTDFPDQYIGRNGPTPDPSAE